LIWLELRIKGVVFVEHLAKNQLTITYNSQFGGTMEMSGLEAGKERLIFSYVVCDRKSKLKGLKNGDTFR